MCKTSIITLTENTTPHLSLDLPLLKNWPLFSQKASGNPKQRWPLEMALAANGPDFGRAAEVERASD